MEETRKLASIVKIKNIYPIEGADKIELAEVNGWKCIVKKNEFRVGELVIYFEIDSIPDLSDPNTSFIKDRGGRIKTIKLRGTLSQGLIGPLSWLKSRDDTINLSELAEGDNVTDKMGVTKYISLDEKDQYPDIDTSNKGPKVPNEGFGKFPEEIPKTDEERLQSHPKLLEKISGRSIVITRKEDGCSCTFVFNNGEFKICGRNYELLDKKGNSALYHYVAEKYDIENKMKAYNKNIAIQGELLGQKINKNKLHLVDYVFRVFNIWNINGHIYLLQDKIDEICTSMGLDQVPILFRGIDHETKIGTDVSDYIKLADEQMYNCDSYTESKYNGTDPAEGIVIKTDDYSGPRISFKVISNKYLLKNDK